MKHTLRYALGIALITGLAPFGAQAANPAGYVDFGKFTATGSELVEVNVNSNLIAMVAKLAQKSEPDVADLVKGLKSIRVNVVGLNDENRSEIETKVKAIRTQLDTDGWEKVVNVQQKKEDVGVYLKLRGPDAVEGVVVTVMDGRKQAVLINIVGNIDPEKLGLLGERFGIDPLKKLGHGMDKKQAEQE